MSMVIRYEGWKWEKEGKERREMSWMGDERVSG